MIAVITLLAVWLGGPQTTSDTRPSFSQYLDGLRTEALSRGIRQDIVDQALSNIPEPLPVVLERDRAQAETVLSLDVYIARRLTPKRIREGREMMERHHELLQRVSEHYGVPARIIVAIWGAETDYGSLTGIRPLVAALATLAWEGRRATFFRAEVFHALEILQRGDIDFDHLKGSWAGAMGQPQFMPSSYLEYAQDFDGDGRKDIWSDPADVFASIANYLKGHGWTHDGTWGREVRVTPAVARRVANDVPRRESACRARRDLTVALPLKRWEELGVRSLNGKPLPPAALNASLVSGTKRHFLVYDNYDAILEYNCANAYAVTVGLLSDAVASTAPIKETPANATVRKRRR